MKWAHLLFTSLLFLSSNAIASSVGFTQITLTDDPKRPLNTAIWYPTQEVSNTTLIGDNPAFVGTKIIKDAQIQSSTFPVVLLSHGYRGNWRNQNWLASEIAKRGYIVAAADHPGTTTFDNSPKQAAKWWERPRDISRVLDHLLTTARWKRHVNAGNVEHVLSLFTQDALVNSPLYGDRKASEFYPELFQDTANSRLTLKGVMDGNATDGTKLVSIWFYFDWTLANGEPALFMSLMF